MSAVAALQEMNFAWIDDVAVVERHKSGRISTHTTHGSVSAGAWLGGLTGLFVGILFPPAMFTFFLVGAGSGAAMQKVVKESGLDTTMLKEIKDSLDKGTSALILIGAKGDADQMANAFEKYKPTKVIRHEIPDTAVDDLKEQFEQAQAAVPDDEHLEGE
jgi:uncharacterized membrane protein